MSEASTNAIILGLVVVFVTVSVLIGIIIKQKQKIDNYEKPRFGFLGKKLSAYVLGVMALSVIGVLAFPWNYVVPDSSVSVSDKDIETIRINYELINIETNEYHLSITPIINGQEWTTSTEAIDVFWLINESFEYAETISFNRNVGVVVKLNQPVNKIRATIYFRDKEITEEITINLID